MHLSTMLPRLFYFRLGKPLSLPSFNFYPSFNSSYHWSVSWQIIRYSRPKTIWFPHSHPRPYPSQRHIPILGAGKSGRLREMVQDEGGGLQVGAGPLTTQRTYRTLLSEPEVKYRIGTWNIRTMFQTGKTVTKYFSFKSRSFSYWKIS